MNGCRQEALTIHMAREHAATPRRNTGGEDDKGKRQEAAQTHVGNKRQAGKASPRPSPWPATPLQPSHTHHRSAASPWVRRFGLHKRKAHAASSHTPMDKNGKRHTATASSSVPRPTGYSHSPLPTHSAHGASNLPSTHTRKRSPHPPTTRRLSPCSHTEHTISSIELTRRPSLKDASVSDGP
ncbi:hypothetical protein TcCL_Unassigned05615 [Trypanosoma cruzi]|nr:hypothetical protein TcCL_Unassigned05615 [Trypanosoma cruzi]